MRTFFVVFVAGLLFGSCSGSDGQQAATNSEEAPTSSDEAPATSVPAPFSGERADEVVFRNGELDVSLNTFPILFMERACAGGTRADDRHRIDVLEDEETIKVNVLVAPPPGDQECPSNPWTPGLVELDRPIGDRQIVGVSRPTDEVASLVDVTARSQALLPAGTEIIDVDTQMGIYAEVRCEDLGLTFGPEVRIGDPHLGSESLFADAFNAIGGPTDGWFRSQSPDGSMLAVQFYNGTTVGSVAVYRNGPGWNAEAGRCADMPGGWAPDDVLPGPDGGGQPLPIGTPATADDLGRVREVLSTIESIESEGEVFRFTDPEVRCPAMNEIEDALHDAGWSVWSVGFYLDESTVPGLGQELARQSETLVSTDEGGAIAIRTRSGGAVEAELLPGAFPGSFGESVIEPYFLDSTVTVDVRAPGG